MGGELLRGGANQIRLAYAWWSTPTTADDGATDKRQLAVAWDRLELAPTATTNRRPRAEGDALVLPAATGALRMAAMITRPAAVELIEVVSGRQIAEVEVHELTVPEDGPLVGTTISDAQARSRHGVLIVAFRGPDGTLEFNPGGDAVFQSGAGVIVMGRCEDIDRFRAEYGV